MKIPAYTSKHINGFTSVFSVLIFSIYCPGNSQELIAPVEISYVSSELTGFERYATNVIDGSGMSDDPVLLTSTHDIVETNMWIGRQNDVTPTIVFDMGESITLLETLVWNYNESGTGVTDRGVNQMEISVSSEATHSSSTTYNSLGTFDFTEGGTNVQIKSTQATGVRLIKFTFISNHGHESYSGLSEVRFNGVRTVPIEIRELPGPGSSKSIYHSSRGIFYAPEALVGQYGILSVFNFQGQMVKTVSLQYTEIINLKKYSLENGPYILRLLFADNF